MIIRFLLSWMSIRFPLSSSASHILTNVQLLPSLQSYFFWSSSSRFVPAFFLQSLASVCRPDTCQSSIPKPFESFNSEIFANLQPWDLHQSSALRSSPIFSPEIFTTLQPWDLHQSSASRSSLAFSFSIDSHLQLLDFHYSSEYSSSYKQLEPKNLSLKYLLHFSEILLDLSSTQHPS